MSWRDTAYARRCRYTRDGRHLTPSERHMLLLIGDSTHPEKDFGWCSVRRLAADSGYAVRSVQRILHALVAGEVVERGTRDREDGSQTSNSLRIADGATEYGPTTGTEAPLAASTRRSVGVTPAASAAPPAAFETPPTSPLEPRVVTAVVTARTEVLAAREEKMDDHADDFVPDPPPVVRVPTREEQVERLVVYAVQHLGMAGLPRTRDDLRRVVDELATARGGYLRAVEVEAALVRMRQEVAARG